MSGDLLFDRVGLCGDHWITLRELGGPQIGVEAPWSEIGAVARRLIDREFAGKAVLHIV
jgi:hypothetical protein